MKKYITTLLITLCVLNVYSQDKGGILGTGTVMNFDLSKDGKNIVFIEYGNQGLSSSINIFDIEKSLKREVLRIDEMVAFANAKFSNDGKSVIYTTENSIIQLNIKSQKPTLLYESPSMLDILCVSENGKYIYFCSLNKLYELNLSNGKVNMISDIGHEVRDISNYGTDKLLLNIDKGGRLFDLICFSLSEKTSTAYASSSTDYCLSSYSAPNDEIIYCSRTTLYKMNLKTKESTPFYTCDQNRILWFEVDSRNKLIYLNTVINMDTLTVVDFEGRIIKTIPLTK